MFTRELMRTGIPNRGMGVLIIIDAIMEDIEEGTLWEMLFADDLVLCDPDR